jgi:hypothetical protein
VLGSKLWHYSYWDVERRSVIENLDFVELSTQAIRGIVNQGVTRMNTVSSSGVVRSSEELSQLNSPFLLSKGRAHRTERGVDSANRVQPFLPVHQLNRVEAAFNVFGGLVETELKSIEREEYRRSTRIFFHESEELPVRSYKELARRRCPQEDVEDGEDLVDRQTELSNAIEDVEIKGVGNSSSSGIVRSEILHINPERGEHFDSFL